MEDEGVRRVATAEVVMIEADKIQQIQVLAGLGWGSKRIAREVDVARNTVRAYVRGLRSCGVQKRPRARRLDDTQVALAKAAFEGEADGNAVVVAELLEGQGVSASLRTVQRAVAPARQAQRAAAAATVRFETPPGRQLQIDFGERRVKLGGSEVLVYFFVATLGFSRRLYVRASLSQRQDEWKLGLEGALRHFGGRPEEVVVDNARALIQRHDGDKVVVHPVFAGFCADRGLAVFACKPYRARTKGKVESGVKYLKRNAIAARSFDSLEALQTHLDAWMIRADRRIHGTTHRRPIDLFMEEEGRALRPLHDPRLPVATQRLERKVANDCHIDLDTVRYSVPHRLARCVVHARQSDQEVVIWYRDEEVARHRRSWVPHGRVTDPAHFAGLLMAPRVAEPEPSSGSLDCGYGRKLTDYAQVVGGQP